MEKDMIWIEKKDAVIIRQALDFYSSKFFRDHDCCTTIKPEAKAVEALALFPTIEESKSDD